ncbi:hypothetical protein [Pigmentiphaga litoralis]
MLNLGTWHAGPYFDGETASFFNLELADILKQREAQLYGSAA